MKSKYFLIIPISIVLLSSTISYAPAVQTDPKKFEAKRKEFVTLVDKITMEAKLGASPTIEELQRIKDLLPYHPKKYKDSIVVKLAKIMPSKGLKINPADLKNWAGEQQKLGADPDDIADIIINIKPVGIGAEIPEPSPIKKPSFQIPLAAEYGLRPREYIEQADRIIDNLDMLPSVAREKIIEIVDKDITEPIKMLNFLHPFLPNLKQDEKLKHSVEEIIKDIAINPNLIRDLAAEPAPAALSDFQMPLAAEYGLRPREYVEQAGRIIDNLDMLPSVAKEKIIEIVDKDITEPIKMLNFLHPFLPNLKQDEKLKHAVEEIIKDIAINPNLIRDLAAEPTPVALSGFQLIEQLQQLPINIQNKLPEIIKNKAASGPAIKNITGPATNPKEEKAIQIIADNYDYLKDKLIPVIPVSEIMPERPTDSVLALRLNPETRAFVFPDNFRQIAQESISYIIDNNINDLQRIRDYLRPIALNLNLGEKFAEEASQFIFKNFDLLKKNMTAVVPVSKYNKAEPKKPLLAIMAPPIDYSDMPGLIDKPSTKTLEETLFRKLNEYISLISDTEKQLKSSKIWLEHHKNQLHDIHKKIKSLGLKPPVPATKPKISEPVISESIEELETDTLAEKLFKRLNNFKYLISNIEKQLKKTKDWLKFYKEQLHTIQLEIKNRGLKPPVPTIKPKISSKELNIIAHEKFQNDIKDKTKYPDNKLLNSFHFHKNYIWKNPKTIKLLETDKQLLNRYKERLRIIVKEMNNRKLNPKRPEKSHPTIKPPVEIKPTPAPDPQKPPVATKPAGPTAQEKMEFIKTKDPFAQNKVNTLRQTLEQAINESSENEKIVADLEALNNLSDAELYQKGEKAINEIINREKYWQQQQNFKEYAIFEKLSEEKKLRELIKIAIKNYEQDPEILKRLEELNALSDLDLMSKDKKDIEKAINPEKFKPIERQVNLASLLQNNFFEEHADIKGQESIQKTKEYIVLKKHLESIQNLKPRQILTLKETASEASINEQKNKLLDKYKQENFATEDEKNLALEIQQLITDAAQSMIDKLKSAQPGAPVVPVVPGAPVVPGEPIEYEEGMDEFNF